MRHALLMPPVAAVESLMAPEADWVVLWDGTSERPMGRYLSPGLVDEQEHARQQRPYRTHRDLQPSEVNDILVQAARYEVEDVAQRFHVSPSTVEHIVLASSMGMLQQVTA